MNQSVANIFDIEDHIKERLQPLFSTEMIFTEENSEHLDNVFFNHQQVAEEDRVGCLIISKGFRADPLVSKRNSAHQRLKPLWQIAVVCPAELYKSQGGVKLIQVIQRLKGWKPADCVYKELEVVSDERGFNEPQFDSDLVYIPALFATEFIL